MSARWLMGLDLGGGGVRCVLQDAGSPARFEAVESWTLRPASGTGGLGYDLDLDALWHCAGRASQAALAAAGAAPGSVAGVAATAMRFGGVLLDGAGEPLLAVPNRDARAAGEGLRLAAAHGERVHAVTGMWPLPIHASARLQWLAAQQPERLERAATLLSLGDWLAFRLGAERFTDFSQAGSTGLFDLRARSWSDELIELLGLPRAIFPEVRASGERIGEVSREAAAAFGLEAGTPIALGAGDTRCGLLGSGAVSAGDVGVVAGTTAPIERIADEPLSDPEGRLRAGFHAAAGLWVLEANLGPMGESLSWIARLLHPDSAQPESRFIAEAGRAEPGAAGMLSSLGVQIQDDRAPSLPIGSFTLSHMTGTAGLSGRAALSRAVLEGHACGVRLNLEEIERASGRAAESLRLSGGMSRNDFFAQLLADVCGFPVQRATALNTTSLGAALCAGVGASVWKDLPEAAGARVAPPDRFEPDSARSEAYARVYPAWRDMRAAQHGPLASIGLGAVLPWTMRAAEHAAAQAGEALHRPKLLVTAAFDDDSIERLRALGEVEYKSFRDHMQMLTGRSLVDALADRDVFVTEVDVVDAAALEQLPGLRVVAACRGDAVNVDIDACTAFGIPVLFAPGRNADAVADLSVAFLLSLARRLPAATKFLADSSVAAGDLGKMGQAFRALQGFELWGKTVGLVGLGAVGRGVAARLAGFGVRLLVADPFVSEGDAALADCEKVDLDTLLAESDFISLHAAVTDATRGMIGADELARMKPGAFLVNTARAALVDEEALVAALESGQLAGAALDTFSVEPPGHDHPLVQHGGVIHTPHVGGNTNEIAIHQGRLIAEALEQLVRGETPSNLRNPEVMEHFSWTGPRRVPSRAELDALAAKPGPAATDLQRDAKAEAQQEDLSGAEAPAELVEKMSRLLERFCQGLASDERIAAASAEQDVALYFVLPDIGLDLHLAMRSGEVASALGRPEGGSVVTLRMRAEVLDGMFRGTINAMERAMAGDIAFSGDAGKAMAIQEVQGDLERVYTAAREEVGDPGDLSVLASPGEATKAAPAAGADDVRHQIVAITQELYESQLITATGGNVSARIPGEPEQVWITPSQLFKGDLSPEVLVRIDLDGQSLDEGARSASSESSMHTRILKKKPEAKAVIHCHAPHATTLANAGLDFLPISTEAAFFGNIPRVPFIMPGTDDLAEAVSEAMLESWAVLMINHGLVVCGRSLRRAADMAEIIERSCELILGCLAVGKEPPVLPPDAVKTLRAMGDLVA